MPVYSQYPSISPLSIAVRTFAEPTSGVFVSRSAPRLLSSCEVMCARMYCSEKSLEPISPVSPESSSFGLPPALPSPKA